MFGCVDSWLLYKLTGNHMTEVGGLSHNKLFSYPVNLEQLAQVPFKSNHIFEKNIFNLSPTTIHKYSKRHGYSPTVEEEVASMGPVGWHTHGG